MFIPSNDITPEVIREVVPPYHPPVAPTPLPTNRATAEPPAPPGGSPDTAAHPDQDTGPEWSITKLDEGPGWSREVLRHRSPREPANNAKPESTP
jgi:hypothetical protein